MDITNAAHLGGYKLGLEFSDGTSGIADLEAHLDGHRVLNALREPALFRQFIIEDGTVRWPNGADFAVEFLYALAHEFAPPRTYEEAKTQQFEMSLRELRTHGDIRQEDLAGMLNITQGAISRLESSPNDVKVSTIRRFVRALGWDVELVAVRGDRRVRLRGV